VYIANKVTEYSQNYIITLSKESDAAD